MKNRMYYDSKRKLEHAVNGGAGWQVLKYYEKALDNGWDNQIEIAHYKRILLDILETKLNQLKTEAD